MGHTGGTGAERWTSDQEREFRLSHLREMMKREGFDALVITGRDDIRFRGRTFYVSDYWQLLADTHAIVLPEGQPIWIGGQVFGDEQAILTDWAEEFRMSGTPGTEIAKVLKERGVANGTIGVVGMTDASLALQHYNEMVEGLPEATLKDATTQFEHVRQHNSEEALRRFEETSQVWRDVYAEIEPQIKPGLTGLQLAAICHKISREHGLRDPMVLLQTTPYGALSFGDDRVITKDDLVTVWIESAGPNGYWLEYRRCYSFGEPTEEQRRAFDVQKLAIDAGMAELKPGVQAHKFAEKVQEVLQAEAGWDLGFKDPDDVHCMYSLHGIGTDAIQGVWVPGLNRTVLENEVVNIHPPVNFSEEDAKKFGWLGITDNVLITKDGGQLMTLDKDATEGFIAL